ncbi:ImmA/IrrE family metallo-endopeptidase [Streptomyces lavendofoliae]|uniref:ImmA/IrrE family metallo-endopeptidase n=1 Tax=Streptomyces lavendofoliae TaxID=67314 RepID=UPI0027E3F3BF|nr:ImmA/IrrE family metallo-endopeptidase [Streptomyces lavendofoliae]
MPYSPMRTLEQLGIPVVRVHLRDTWGAWSPVHRKIVIATGLSARQERCVLAHEAEHALADDLGCGVGLDAAHPLALHQERRADIEAARKLIHISDLAAVAQWADDVRLAAAELDVTERMLRIRLHDLNGEGWPWPATSKIAG